MDDGRYVLRRAVDLYWLVDSGQRGYPLKKPLVMNDMGARIFQLFNEGKSSDEISDILSAECEDVDRAEIFSDVSAFIKQLNLYIERVEA